jgi:hypothetical protein
MSEIQELSTVLVQLQAIADDVKFTALPMLQDVIAERQIEAWRNYWLESGANDNDGYGHG